MDLAAALRRQGSLAEDAGDGETAARDLDLVAGVQGGVAADAEGASRLQPQVDPAPASKRQRPGREGSGQQGVAVDGQGGRTAGTGDGLGSPGRGRVDGGGVVGARRRARGLGRGGVGPVARRAPGAGQGAGPDIVLAHDTAAP